jgi:diaminohydroxyphosphoribosylaminopyrimidine deaminase / 5-amino-6-(5-phosphoribosylamino)uracil reductase
MALAIALGKRGLGRCWPNPSVGAVIVAPGGRVISCGWTSPGGRPHAEVNALADAGVAARGATLYATLEPCAHWGRTPPCSDAVIAAGIARLVYGVIDPDPRVAGAGLARLRAHGVSVAAGPLTADARWLALGHELRITAGRPFVQLKLALDADGAVPQGNGAPLWATGEAARARGHLLRAEADAILVGRGTVIADNPDLTCRLPGLESRSPVRVVLSRNADLPMQAKMLRNLDRARVWVVHAPDAPMENLSRLAAFGVECLAVEMAADNGGLDIGALARTLAERGITRLLIEGGPSVAAGFLRADLVDEAVLFQSRTSIDGPRIRPTGLGALSEPAKYRLYQQTPVGDDVMTVYRRAQVWQG